MRLVLSFLLMPMLLSSVQLQYTPDVTVMQRHTAIVTMEQQLPHEMEKTRMEQVVDLELRVISNGSLEPVERPPLHLQMVIKRLQINLTNGTRTQHFDTAGELQIRDPLIARLHRLVGRPLQIKLDEHWQLGEESEELTKYLKEIPSLNSYLTPGFFNQLLKPLVALAGENLEPGGSWSRSMEVGRQPGIKLPLGYRVKSANLREVQADLGARHENKKVAMGEGMAELTGVVKGEITWTRRHALEAQMERHEFYDGTITTNRDERPVKMTITHQIQSHRKS